MWLDIVDKGQLINLDYVESILLEHQSEDHPWTLCTVTHSGTILPLATYKDLGDANRALDRVRHALETIVLPSEQARPQ